MMDLYKLNNKICEIRSYIASDWPSVEERKRLYEQLYQLEKTLKEIKDEAENQPKKN